MKTVRLLLAALVISCLGICSRAAEKPAGAVDQLTGYKSFKLGTPQADLLSRLVRKKTTVTRMVPWQGRMAPQDFIEDAPLDPNGTYDAIVANSPEASWAGCNTRVKLAFAEGMLAEIYVSVENGPTANVETFKAAWRTKYGTGGGVDVPARYPGALPPLLDAYWVGNDTCVAMYTSSGFLMTFWSRTVDAQIAKIRTEKATEQAKKNQEAAAKMAKEL
jgi:hypothetical protein